MSFQEEIEQAEERLRRDFSEKLNAFYRYEENSREGLLDQLYGNEEEEEEEEED